MMKPLFPGWAFLLAGLALGCSDTGAETVDCAECGEPDGGAGGNAADAPAPLDSTDNTAACTAAATTLAEELSAGLGACTTTLWLDEDFAPKGYQLACGPYAATSSQSALATVDEIISAEEPDHVFSWGSDVADEATGAFVFVVEPTDLGAFGAVDKRTGLLALAGLLSYGGSGTLLVPDSWRDPAELGWNCASDASLGAISAYGLHPPLGPQTEPFIDAALDATRQTVIADAAWAGGAVFDTTVLRYYPGGFSGESPEWFVMVHSGWVE